MLSNRGPWLFRTDGTARIAGTVGIPHTEIDALHWLAGQRIEGAHERGQLLVGPALTDPVPLVPGMCVTARFPGLGTVRLGAVVLLCVAGWLLPYGLGSYAIHVADVTIVFALLAVGLGLAMGVAGQINLAQVAFFGVSAYAG